MPRQSLRPALLAAAALGATAVGLIGPALIGPGLPGPALAATTTCGSTTVTMTRRSRASLCAIARGAAHAAPRAAIAQGTIRRTRQDRMVGLLKRV